MEQLETIILLSLTAHKVLLAITCQSCNRCVNAGTNTFHTVSHYYYSHNKSHKYSQMFYPQTGCDCLTRFLQHWHISDATYATQSP